MEIDWETMDSGICLMRQLDKEVSRDAAGKEPALHRRADEADL